MDISMDPTMIAPCGINCGLCLAHQRIKNQCLGCHVDFPTKNKYCTNCIMVKCEKRKGKDDYCYVCDDFPCTRLKALDKRYRGKYNLSPIENLETIKTKGIPAFIEKEKEKWACKECGGYICMHRGFCLECDKGK